MRNTVHKKGLHTYGEIRKELRLKELELDELICKGRENEAKKKAAALARDAGSFHVYDIVISCHKYLRKYHYCVNSTLYKNSVSQIEKFTYLLNDEEQICDFYHDLRKCFKRNRTLTESIISKSLEYSSIIEEKKNAKDSRGRPILRGPFFMRDYYYINCVHYSVMKDFEAQIKYALEGYEYFDQRFLHFDRVKYNLLTYIIEGYFAIKDYENAERFLELQSSINLEVDYMSKVLSQQVAARIEMIVKDSPYSVCIGDTSRGEDEDYSQLIRLYQCILEGEEPTKEYNVGAYHYTDSTGYGVAVHIARCIISRINDNHLDEEKRIKQFVWEKLKDDPRSKLMFDYLINSTDVRKELSKHTWNHEIEIIPYEDMIKRIEAFKPTLPLHQ